MGFQIGLHSYADFGGSITSLLPGQTSTHIVLTTGPAVGPSGIARNLTLYSDHYGTLVFPNAYTYNPFGYVSTVHPGSGKYYGGNVVTITGVNLGNGTDITLVTLKSIQATILNQTVNDVTVVAGAVLRNDTGLGNATVYSRSYGRHGMCIPNFILCFGK